MIHYLLFFAITSYLSPSLSTPEPPSKWGEITDHSFDGSTAILDDLRIVLAQRRESKAILVSRCSAGGLPGTCGRYLRRAKSYLLASGIIDEERVFTVIGSTGSNECTLEIWLVDGDAQSVLSRFEVKREPLDDIPRASPISLDTDNVSMISLSAVVSALKRATLLTSSVKVCSMIRMSDSISQRESTSCCGVSLGSMESVST
jgi:hypothetical protein